MQQAIRAADNVPVAIFAFRDERGRPTAWPITPYVDGETIVVTSTLAYMQKAVHVRRDGRVALLVGGVLASGQARVHADVSGDEFVTRFLEQELRKFPPARDIVGIPFHRYLFNWYFGRVFMEVTPDLVTDARGADQCTLTTLDERGFPVITPIEAPATDAASFPLRRAGSTEALAEPDGPATVLIHEEPTMSDLRQLILRGRVRAGVFHVRSRTGSLAAPPARGWLGELRQQIEYHRKAREARAIIDRWER